MTPAADRAVRRTLEMAAVFMIGDGVLGLVRPVGHVALWRSEVGAVDALVRPFAGRPGRRRAYGAVQVLAGVVLAARLVRGRGDALEALERPSAA